MVDFSESQILNSYVVILVRISWTIVAQNEHPISQGRARTKIFHSAGSQCSFSYGPHESTFGPWIPGLKLRKYRGLNILIQKRYNFRSKIDDATVQN